MSASHQSRPIDEIDRGIILATQDGLPRTSRPFAQIAKQIGVGEDVVLERMARMKHLGIIRKLGAVPNHYGLGVRANGMTVWDVADDLVQELGARVGALDFVSHCYRRPRRLPDWPYNLFAMVHGRDRDEVKAKAAEIAATLGAASRGGDILFSTRVLKKTGLRLVS